MGRSYFPANYVESRDGFLKSINEISGEREVYRWKVPCEFDQDLFVDSVYFPPINASKRLYILISGTHGLEGYAGSGIQQLFMQEYLNHVNREESGFILIHSLNPFGFKYHRRGTERGVNLNRNCSIQPSFFQAPNDKSTEFTKLFIPKQAVDSETSHMLKRAKTKEDDQVEFDGITLDEFVKVVGLGQFQDPQGLEFGGSGPEPQIVSFINLLQKLIPRYDDIIQLDLHTGLGDRGRLHLLVDGQDEGLHPELFSELLQPNLDSAIYAFTDSRTPGFYKTRGATNNLIAELVNTNQRACALTLEFGTLGHDLKAQLEALNSWMLDHQGVCYGYANKEIEAKIKKSYLERFFPSDPQWQLMVLQASREFFKIIFQRSGIL